MQINERYNYIAGLIALFLDGTITSSQEEELYNWVGENEANRALFDKLTNPHFLERQLQELNSASIENAWEKIAPKLSTEQPVKRIGQRKIWKAAAILIPLIALSFLAIKYLSKTDRDKIPVAQELPASDNKIFPRGNMAKLTLGDGKIIELGDLSSQSLTEKDGTQVLIDDNIINYEFNDAKAKAAVTYNTLETPRGAEYQVRLSDGTIVRLNAASTLKYPTHFESSERTVFLSGEAYFDVEKQSDLSKFTVVTEQSSVIVLGTQFNVSAYNEEEVQKTTLKEGSVKIQTASPGGSADVVLTPGHQASISKSSGNIRVNEINVDVALAWTKGLFIFESESLSQIMHKLARWYDVEVIYNGDVDKSLTFTGKIARYEDINDILHLLELTGKISFSLSNRQLIIKKGKSKSESRTKTKTAV